MAGVTLDTTAPIGTVAIPGAIMFQGVAYTNSADVSLALSASDGSGAGLDAMRVSNDGSNWAPWEPFAANRAWPLNPGDGVKTVYVEYRDTVGNFSTPVTANITLRTTAPDVALTTPALRVAGPFVVTAAFTDPVAEFDAGDATVTNGTISGFGGSGNTYQWTVTPVSDQPVSVFVAADACVGPVNLWNTASNTLELTIDHPPAAEGQDVSTFRDTPVAITLVGADLDGDPLTYRIVTGPAHGALEGAGPSFTYTPATGYVGADSFAYVTHDGIADSAPATVTITILPPPVGSLTMNVEPEYARTANATWQVDGGDSHASGETVSDLPVGDHVVSFSDIPAQDTGGCFGSTVTYVTPADLHVTVSLNQTTTITATYEKETKSLAATAPSGSQLGDLLILGCAAATLGGLTSKRKKRGSV
jgi:hypothetical protein